MDEIKECTKKLYLENGTCFSTITIAQAVGLLRETMYEYLVEVNERGAIEYDGQEVHTSRLLGNATIEYLKLQS